MPLNDALIHSTMAKIEVGRVSAVPEQLAQQVREMIYSGELPEGAKVPSNQHLSDIWGVSRASVQTAMASLVKEGLVHRARKRGTFVAQRHRKPMQVGIYLSENIWRRPDAAFRRNVVGILGEQLREKKLEMDVWIDPRPRSEQTKPLTELIRAIDQRLIQAVLWPDYTIEAYTWFEQLKIPWVVLTPARLSHAVYFEMGAAERLAAGELARQGCKSVGIIVPTTDNVDSDNPSEREYARAFHAFSQRALALGLEVREEWLLRATSERIAEAGSEQYGYEAMKRLLSMPNRPEGVYVTYDVVARGAIMAVLESRINVPQDLKLVLHRNTEIGLLCPLKVSFVDYNINQASSAMMSHLEAQLKGEEVAPGRFAIQPTLCPAE